EKPAEVSGPARYARPERSRTIAFHVVTSLPRARSWRVSFNRRGKNNDSMYTAFDPGVPISPLRLRDGKPVHPGSRRGEGGPGRQEAPATLASSCEGVAQEVPTDRRVCREPLAHVGPLLQPRLDAGAAILPQVGEGRRGRPYEGAGSDQPDHL